MRDFMGMKHLAQNIFKIIFWICGSLILFYIISRLYNNIIEWLLYDFKIKDKVIYLFGDMDISRQLAMPFVIGFIGSSAASMIMLLKGHTNVKIKIFNGYLISLNWVMAFLISSFIGGIAGVGAVNILNSDGSTTEVLVIALVAGLSGVSYLKGIALVNVMEEDGVFTKVQEEAVDNGEHLIEQGAIEDNEYADSWEDFIDTFVRYKVTKFENDNSGYTEQDYHAYIDEIEHEINEIWRGDNDDYEKSK